MSKIKKSFKKSMYRGIEFAELIEKEPEEFVEMLAYRKKRRFIRKTHGRKYENLVKKLVKAKNAAPEGEKPEMVKTHLRNCVVSPPMVGSLCGVYNGKVFNPVEIRPEMIGHYLGEFSFSYKPVTHGKLGVGATRSSKFTAAT